jgi:hypothetical protein
MASVPDHAFTVTSYTHPAVRFGSFVDFVMIWDQR